MSDDKILYHYTDAAGLLGILTPIDSLGENAGKVVTQGSVTLHATDVRYLNDRAELEFGAKLLADRLRKRAASQEPLLAQGMTRLAESLEANHFVWEGPFGRNRMAAHVACFCEERDLLSQWRGYGGNGAGYAIGIRMSVLQTAQCYIDEDPPSDVSLSKVVYGEREAGEYLDWAIDSLLREDRHRPAFADGAPTNSAHYACLHTTAEMKHDAFQEEKEWRLIAECSPPDMPEFRAGRTGIIPYVEFSINAGWSDPPKGSGLQSLEDRKPTIAELRVGPGPDSELRADAVRRLLHKLGHDPRVVTRSDVTYRP